MNTTPPSDLNKLLKIETPIVICDIGASPVDPTPFIDDLINNTNSILYGFEPNEDEFKKLSKDYAVLEKMFENFQTAQIKRDADIEEATLEYTAQISDFGSDISEVKEDIKSMKKIYWDVKNTINRIMWTIGGVIAFLTVLQLFTGKTVSDFVK